MEDSMKIRIHGMLGTNHSWAFTQQAIARAVIEAGKHEVFLKSTNGLKHFPLDLQDNLLPGLHSHPEQPMEHLPFKKPDGYLVKIPRPPKGKIVNDLPDTKRPYDMELAYTILYQGPRRFFPDTTCKMLIWNFESSILPPGWHLYHRSMDYILPSSQYSADIFTYNGIPSSKTIVVPHGVYTDMFNPDKPPIKLNTNKRVKFLHNAIPHHRKLHERVLKAYLDAFDPDDDVCLVLKTKLKTPDKDKPFEVDVREILKKVTKGRKRIPEIEIINTFIPDIGSLYTACDAVVSMSSAEGFALPLLEGLACDMIVIAPRHGGQLQFLNDKNSLLIDTEEMAAPLSMQYWTMMKEAVVGDPSIRHCSELMRRVYENTDLEKKRVKRSARATVRKFTWEAASKQITDLAEDCVSKKSKIHKTISKKKVLYIVPYSMAGGGEVWIREAIKRIDRNQYDPSIAFPLGLSSELHDMFSELNVDMEDLKDRGGDNALKVLIDAERYDIVHFYNSLKVYSVLLRCFQDGWRGKIVETVHSDLLWPDSMVKIAARKCVSMIIGVSETVTARIRKIGNDNVHVLPQQIDWEKFKIPRNKSILEELSLPSDKFTVGTIARISPEKNIPLIPLCARAMPHVLFVIVGDGPQLQILKKTTAKLSNIKFVGRRVDTERFYSAFDAFLLPSLVEGMPLTILEAMTAGVPVVASRVGAIPELINNGRNGFLVDNPKNVRMFVEALSRVINNNTLCLGAKKTASFMESRGKRTDINTLYDILF
jgi:glycosyltransferase involved in cell wall biosynthesis